jgi:hypothetical protein
MGLEQLQKTVSILEWDRTSHPEKHKQDVDETASCALLRACVLRNMKQFAEAREVLKTEILNHDKYVCLFARLLHLVVLDWTLINC